MSDITLNDKDYWRLLTLYGLNTSTYKIALANCLINFTEKDKTSVTMHELATEFFDLYLNRLNQNNNMPQLNHDTRTTVMEQAVMKYKNGILTYGDTIDYVAKNAFNDVIPRFHVMDRKPIEHSFYQKTKSGIVLTDSVFNVFQEEDREELKQELDSRWSLLESAFSIKRENAQLINDLKQFYLLRGYERTDITYMQDMLYGYQEGRCFYCGEKLTGTIHVDHVIPRAYLYHDEPWNLVLSHSICNMSKSDALPDKKYIVKLINRNELLIKSNHPLSKGIIASLGKTSTERSKETMRIYEEIRSLVKYTWDGILGYNVEHDEFFKKYIRNGK